MNKIIIIVSIIVIVAIIVGVVLMTTGKTETIPTHTTPSEDIVPSPPVGTASSYATSEEANEIPVTSGGLPPIPQPRIINEKKPIKDSGYPDNSDREFKSGWYDILGQGVANDYCRYVGDNPNIFFACVLSDGSNDFAKEYNGKAVTEIAKTALKDACANTTDGNISQECYSEIWKQAGCTNTSTSVSNYGWAKGQSKASLINDSKSWATLNTDVHRKGCYGENKTNWPASYIRYSSRNNFMSY